MNAPVAALVVGGSMLVKDVLATIVTSLVASGHGLAAGVFDAMGDVAALVTFGVGGVEVLHHGLSVYTLVVIAALAAASIVGTAVGTSLGLDVGRRLTPRKEPVR